MSRRWFWFSATTTSARKARRQVSFCLFSVEGGEVYSIHMWWRSLDRSRCIVACTRQMAVAIDFRVYKCTSQLLLFTILVVRYFVIRWLLKWPALPNQEPIINSFVRKLSRAAAYTYSRKGTHWTAEISATRYNLWLTERESQVGNNKRIKQRRCTSTTFEESLILNYINWWKARYDEL